MTLRRPPLPASPASTQVGSTLVKESAGLDAYLWHKRMAVLPDHTFPKDYWSPDELSPQSIALAKRSPCTWPSGALGCPTTSGSARTARRSDSGHQTSILTTNVAAPLTTLAVSLVARWCQEHFVRYMREHDGVDRLVEYGTETIPDAVSVVNPLSRTLDSQVRAKTGQRHRLWAQFGALTLSADPAESELESFTHRKGQRQDQIQHLDREIEILKRQRKETPHHLPVNALPEPDRFTRLRTERKHFVDTIKMIAYRTETSMASLLREHLTRTPTMPEPSCATSSTTTSMCFPARTPTR